MTLPTKSVYHASTSKYQYNTLEVQPPFFMGWFPNHPFLSKIVQKGPPSFKWWLTSRDTSQLQSIVFCAWISVEGNKSLDMVKVP